MIRSTRPLPFIVFLVGAAVLTAAFIVLVRTPGDRSPSFYAKMLILEIAAVALALATEYRRTR